MQNKLLRQEAYQQIKKAIVTLRFEMGKSLSEQELGKEMGLTRMPVREALQQLAREGLVVIMPRKGAYVSHVTFDDFHKVFQSRVMLENYCIVEAAAKISNDEIDRLCGLLSDIDTLVEVRDIDALLKIDRQIHMGIVQSLENQYINHIAEQIYDSVTRMWYISFKTKAASDLLYSAKSHKEILDALRQREAEKAQHLNRKHLDRFIEQIYQSLLHKANIGKT